MDEGQVGRGFGELMRMILQVIFQIIGDLWGLMVKMINMIRNAK